MECKVKLSKYNEVKGIDSKSLVRSLHYLTCTRLGILYVVGLVSWYMKNPKAIHFKVAKRIPCYIKGTIDFGFLYSVSNDYKLARYNNNDWGGDADDQKSTTWFVLFTVDIASTWM